MIPRNKKVYTAIETSKFQGVAKMLLILCILSNTQIFGIFNRAPSPWWSWCMQNKLYACMMIFFLSNTIEGQLVSSGAFEISLNDIPVWSKLETGRIPHPPELFLIIDNTLNFSTDDTIKEGFVKWNVTLNYFSFCLSFPLP